MDLNKLGELKRKLLQDAKLPPVWSFFLDHFGDKPEFIALGERTSQPFVEAVIAEVGRQLFGDQNMIQDLILKRIPGQNFIHGGFGISGHLGGVIFFEDASIGLVMAAEQPPSIEVKYARFSGTPARRIPTPSLN
jgi:hypothetical protein